MTKQYCAECGHEYPSDARFCMYCGYMLSNQAISAPTNESPEIGSAGAAADHPPAEKGTDWAMIVTAFLAFLGLRHASRKARQTAIVVVILMMFFGCPMVCGFIAFVMEWFANLLQ